MATSDQFHNLTCTKAADPAASWFRRLFCRARITPLPNPLEHAAINVSFALQMDLKSSVWLAAGGISMLPWPTSGYEVKIEPIASEPVIGSIIVFRRGAKLYYHRIVECLGANRWRTKGDTLIESDDPVSGTEIIGQVTAARRGKREWAVPPDYGAAQLSARLGRCFGGPDRQELSKRHRILRLVYLAILLSVWPFRGWFAHRPATASTDRNADPVDRN
jgi:hypothetical protein